VDDVGTTERKGRVLVITLDRPEARNAVNGDVARGLESAIDELADDDELWVASCALSPLERSAQCSVPAATSRSSRPGLSARSSPHAAAWPASSSGNSDKPVIAAVDGLATGGGCELVITADPVVASARVLFGLAEVKRNLIARGGRAFRLPCVIGLVPAMVAVLTGELIPARRAYEFGMVNLLVAPEQLSDEAFRLASQIVDTAPLAARAGRRIARATSRLDDDAQREMANGEVAQLLRSEDTPEGLAAFAEKRAPVWKAR
jgi:enoyl-CoA hydratase